MAWRAITQDDVLTALTGPELSATRTAAIAVGQADPLPAVIQSVTDEVRGYIAGSVSITLGAEGTIPDKLVNTACDMAVWYLLKRLPVKSLITEARRDAYDEAMRKLRDVAANRFRIEMPTTVTNEQIAVPMPSIAPGPSRLRRRWEDGI